MQEEPHTPDPHHPFAAGPLSREQRRRGCLYWGCLSTAILAVTVGFVLWRVSSRYADRIGTAVQSQETGPDAPHDPGSAQRAAAKLDALHRALGGPMPSPDVPADWAFAND